MRKILIGIGFLFSTIILHSQVKYSNEFLNLGAGARAMGMSNSVVASTKDATAGYWNPSALINQERQYEVSLMHAEYFAGISKYDYIGTGYKIDETSAVGFSMLRMGVDDIPNTLELIDEEGNIRYDRIKTFSAADYAFIGSYSHKLPVEGLIVGGNVKVIHRKTGDFAKAWGFGLDAAASYTKGKWLLGALAKDVTSTFNAWSFNTAELEDVFLLTGNEIPENSLELTLPRLILGAARSFQINDKMGCLAEIDMDFTFDGKRHVLLRSNFASIDPHLGFEFDYKNMVFLRGGIGNMQKVKTFDGKVPLTIQPNFGIGIKYRNFAIDYSLTDIADQSIALYSNVFSLSYSFDYSK